MKSFAGFLLFLVFRWQCRCSWRSLTRFSGPATQNTDTTTNRRGSLFIIPSTHQSTSDIIPGLVLWSRYPEVGDMGRKLWPEPAGNISHVSAMAVKIGRYAERIGLKLFASPGTLSSLLQQDSRWDFEEKFRGFCAARRKSQLPVADCPSCLVEGGREAILL